MDCVKSRKMSKMSKLEYVMSKHGQSPMKKHMESNKWKRAKNVALQKQSRSENEFIEETLFPERHLSARNQRYANFLFSQTHSFLLKTPLGAGW